MNTLVVAYDENRVIGKDGDIPWKIPEDMRHFKELTTGGCVIMGRKTWDSLGDKYKPLPNRMNVVLSRKEGWRDEMVHWERQGAYGAATLEEANALHMGKRQNFIIGGGEIYRLALNSGFVDRIVASEIKGKHDGDTTFPELDNWQGQILKEYKRFVVVEYFRCDLPFEAAHAACAC